VSSGGGIKITGISYPGANTAANTNGGQTIQLNGTGFKPGVIVSINNATVPATSFINANSITFTTPAGLAARTFQVYVTNTDGSSTILFPGIDISNEPVWVTTSPLPGFITPGPISIDFSATGDGEITYALASGSSLPEGLSIASNGRFSGTKSANAESDTTYTFDVVATDANNQSTTKTFSLSEIVTLSGTGGTVSNITGYRVHTFTSSDTFTINAGPRTVEYLIVAGGGGGGAGGVLTGNLTMNSGVTYTVTVGAGGVASYAGSAFAASSAAVNGANSSVSGSDITSIIAVGGGAGATSNTVFGGGPISVNGTSYKGANGGSGGGGGGNSEGPNIFGNVPGGVAVYPGSPFISGTRQGYNGGAGGGYGNSPAGGGGGASAAGEAAQSNRPGVGGAGSASPISGSPATYGGGGGGGSYGHGGSAGGSGGGGAGRGFTQGGSATSGSTNTGGGGGGGGVSGGSGGSGIIILRYAV
jgi:hypothetical protein